MENSATQVLIVGAGPVGIAVAIQLCRFGVAVRIIDAAERASTETKAMAIHSRTLEVFRDLGVIEPFLDLGVRVERFVARYRDRSILRYDFARLGTCYPFILSLPQPDSERFLSARLAAFGVQVERQVELVKLAQDENQVRAVLRYPDGVQREEVYPWVVGTDGGRSVVRRDLGISFTGASYHRYFMLTDVDIDWDGSHSEGCFLLGSGEGYVGLAPIPGERRYRFFLEMPHALPPHHARPALSVETFQKLVDERGLRMKLSNASSMTMAEFRHRMVDKLRVGRVFLAGDAAHIGSPIGGQYMNLGINEAYNLGFKLAYVLLRKAEPRLLDSYEQERLPVAREAQRTAHVLTKLFTVTHPVGLFARNRLLPMITELPRVRDALPRGLSGHAFRYRGAGALAEQVEPARTRRPALRKRKLRVRAGELAPDVELGSRSVESRLSDVFAGTALVVLLCAGEVTSLERHQQLLETALRLRARYGSSLRPIVVWPGTQCTGEMGELEVLLDVEGRVHERYGAHSGGYYVVRPAAYLGYVGPDGLESDLVRYLDCTLALRRAPSATQVRVSSFSPRQEALV
jgi:2-polyprenyl-6-methoxyphenol hydroxylase-like FAD-dependent oxidoreductase